MLDINPQPHQLKFLKCNGTEDKDPIRIVFFGGGAGGGKTWSILVDNIFGIHDPDYFSVFFRKTNNELETNLWPEAKKLYEPILFDKNGKPRGKAHIAEKDKVITFPSGAKSKFSYLLYDKDADSWYGSELCKVYIDELQMHSEYAFHVLRSRNRSRAKVPKGMRFTLNPSPDHWMYEWIKPFLDVETGFPNEEDGGRTRYYLIMGGQLHTSWDKQELVDEFGKQPQTYTYVPARLEQNKVLQEIDPDYFNVLDSLPEAKRNQLLLGSWAPVEQTGLYLEESMFNRVDSIPLGSTTVRGWDTAGTGVEEGQEVNRYADWTVGIKMSKSPDGEYYIHGMERFQKRSGPRDNHIINTGHRDGVDCPIIMAADVGAAGNFQFQEFAKKATEAGLICKKDPTPSNKSKLTRGEPFITAVQNGLVNVVTSSFEPDQLKRFFYELSIFDGERSVSNKGKWDDIFDACATSFNYLAKKRVVNIVPRNQNHSATHASRYLQSTQDITTKSLNNQKEIEELYNNG